MYNRSVNKLKYLSVAVNALKKLKNQSVAAAKGKNIGRWVGEVNKANEDLGFLLVILMFHRC